MDAPPSVSAYNEPPASQPARTNNNTASRHSSISASTPPQLQTDDQDKKIKTLADNIIAAMPRKIKTNSYSSLTSSQQASLNLGEQVAGEGVGAMLKASFGRRCRPVLDVLRRNATSFDDNSFVHTEASVSNTPTCASSGYYSSSARSSLSPVSTMSFQFQRQQHRGSDVGDLQADSDMFEQQAGNAGAAIYDPAVLSDNFRNTSKYLIFQVMCNL